MWLSTLLIPASVAPCERCPFDRHQLMPHRHEMLAHDMQGGMRHEMVDIGHPTRNGVLDWNHAEARFAGADCGKRVLESRAGNCLVIRKHLASSEMGVRSRLSLKHDLLDGNHAGSGTHAEPASQ